MTTDRQETAHGSSDTDRSEGGSAVSLALRLLSVGPLLILILLVAAISQLTPSFLKPINIGNILAQTAVIAIVAIGQHLVILTRGIDLSVGANLALATVVGGLVFRINDSSPLVMLAMLAASALVGAINGVVFVYGRLPHPFIITLATLSMVGLPPMAGFIAKYYTRAQMKAMFQKYFRNVETDVYGQKNEVWQIPGSKFKDILVGATPNSLALWLTRRFGRFLLVRVIK